MIVVIFYGVASFMLLITFMFEIYEAAAFITILEITALLTWIAANTAIRAKGE